MDTGDCQPLYHAIRDYYEGLNMRIDQQIPMLLVERLALNEAIEGEKHVRIFSSSIFDNAFGYLFISEPLPFCRVTITCQKQEVYAFRKSRLLLV